MDVNFSQRNWGNCVIQGMKQGQNEFTIKIKKEVPMFNQQNKG